MIEQRRKLLGGVGLTLVGGVMFGLGGSSSSPERRQLEVEVTGALEDNLLLRPHGGDSSQYTELNDGDLILYLEGLEGSAPPPEAVTEIYDVFRVVNDSTDYVTEVQYQISVSGTSNDTGLEDALYLMTNGIRFADSDFDVLNSDLILGATEDVMYPGESFSLGIGIDLTSDAIPTDWETEGTMTLSLSGVSKNRNPSRPKENDFADANQS